MNQVIEAIRNRRSVRAYDPRPVPTEILQAVIEAGNLAPSGMNTQPWRFVVVRDEGFRKKLLERAVPNSLKYLEPVRESNPARYSIIRKRYEELPDPVYYGAPAIVFVVGKGTYAAESCPLACENMMLAAYSLGLGSCWVKLGSLVTDSAEIMEALELKEGEEIYGPILLGYAAQPAASPPKKAPVVKWI